MSVTPDTKDWTWVLDRRCPECGFDASALDPTTIPALVVAVAERWRELGARGLIRAGRMDAGKWSPLEYACHVRDVFRRYDERFALMLVEPDPLFANWDQDRSAIEENYDGQDPAVVIEDLCGNASRLATQLQAVGADGWLRPGRRSDGASFTVASMSRYMIHDPVHHLWDVSASVP